ncbi:MAG: tetratricopeptide repeat protein [Prevotella sp.]|jgi:Flp pilus assembly protein TadD|nr:tetratricopeptide repeat protein [Prevotella sp.]
MKKTKALILGLGVLLMTSCSGKLGQLTSDNFKVTPNPLESEAGQVAATVNGTFPEKYMKKKAVVTVVPELRFTKDGIQQSVKGQPATFQGEKVLGNDQTISYVLGGHYTMKTQFPYEDAMQKSELFLTFDAKVGKKAVQVPAVKVADGVIATSELWHKSLQQSTGSVAQDAFQRVVAQKQEANIKFLIQQAELRKSELKNGSVQEFVTLLKQISQDRERLNLQNVEVSAYASPDGGFTLNEKLANQRQQKVEGYVKQQMKQANLTEPIEASYTAQDWEGFQQLVAASNIQDKDVILRVLSMYKDPEEREQQIKNMSAGFRELADGILPELRRARMTINYETIGRNDQQIQQQLKDDATQLSIEEMLYAATLTDNTAEKKDIYEKTTRQYAQDVRAFNNLATLAWQQGNFTEARQWLEKAQNVKADCPEVLANLGMLALQQGDLQTAENYIGRAAGAYNLAEALGNLHLAQGNYALAAQDMKDVVSNSAGLAQLLNKDYVTAAQTLRAIKNSNGLTDYLQAIVCARQGNEGMAGFFLRQAIEKDASLATYAANDLELSKVEK